MRKALRLRSRGMMNTKNPEASAIFYDADDTDTIVQISSTDSIKGFK